MISWNKKKLLNWNYWCLEDHPFLCKLLFWLVWKLTRQIGMIGVWPGTETVWKIWKPRSSGFNFRVRNRGFKFHRPELSHMSKVSWNLLSHLLSFENKHLKRFVDTQGSTLTIPHHAVFLRTSFHWQRMVENVYLGLDAISSSLWVLLKSMFHSPWLSQLYHNVISMDVHDKRSVERG